MDKPAASGSGNLVAETAAFERDRARLLQDHAGKFALYKGEEFVGAFDSFDSAYGEGVRRFLLAPFLIKKVLEEDRVEHIPALWLGLIRANL